MFISWKIPGYGDKLLENNNCSISGIFLEKVIILYGLLTCINEASLNHIIANNGGYFLSSIKEVFLFTSFIPGYICKLGINI